MYIAGVQYPGTYSINALLYAQELKRVLVKKGVRIFESSQVEEIDGMTAKTHQGSVTAKRIIMCIDKVERTLSEVSNQVYHAQTFLSISEPLRTKEIKAMFPSNNLMCWDSKLVYTYYRLTGDRRLLVGGGSALTTFTPFYVNSPTIIKKVVFDLRKRFPVLNNIEFTQYWPGHIDTTKDLIPIVDFNTGNKKIQYVLGCVGLPWAAFCGKFAAKRLLQPGFCDTYCSYLSKERKFFIPNWVQHILTKPLAFALNNAYSKYVQKDCQFINN